MNTLLQQNSPIFGKVLNLLSKFFIIIYGQEYLKLGYLLILIVSESFIDYMISKESTTLISSRYIYDAFKKFFVYTLYIVIAGGTINIMGFTPDDIDFRQITIGILFFIQAYNLIIKVGILGFRKESNLLGKSLKAMLIKSEFGQSIIKSANEEQEAKDNIDNISEEIKKGKIQQDEVVDNKTEINNNFIISHDVKEIEKSEGENDEKHS